MRRVKGKFVSDREIAASLKRKNQPMCDYGAWHWLLSEAAFQDHPVNNNGRIISIKRGQIPTSFRNLAEDLSWSTNRVSRFLKSLSRIGLISTTADTGFLIVTISNYEEIQSFYKNADTPMKTRKGTEADTSAETNRTNETKKQIESVGRKPKSHWQVLLEKKYGLPVYTCWFERLTYYGGFVFCPSEFIKHWCERHYQDAISEALCSAGRDFKGFKVLMKAANV